MEDLQWLLRLFLGLVFAISASVKLLQRRTFADTLSAMEIFPQWLSRALSRVLAPLEMAAGVSVAMRWLPSVSGPFVACLLCSFLIVLLVYRNRGGRKVVCGCFGDFEFAASVSTLILRNGLLLVCALLLIFNDGPVAAGHGVEDWVMGLMVVVGTLLAWILWSRLIEAVTLLRDDKQEI